ncbi:MAG: sigma-70 family RNA polymerase sigma factor [Clostridia bacterium]|nr:sigma-70 family RNA polymerase sigma factor [Clostridia bacterium]
MDRRVMDCGAECWRRYLDGDESGFDELLKTHRDSLTFFILRYVHDESIAEDLCIDTFMELLLHKRRYNFKIPLKNYLFIVARSRAVDYLRHAKKFATVELSEAENETADGQTPEEILLKNEQSRALSRAMQALPDEMQIAMHLVYLEKLSYKEAAKVMKISPKQVDNLLTRAKSALRTTLSMEGDLFS